MVIDEPTLTNALQDLAIKYRLERERTKSVTRTIAKAKQEAILEVIDIVNGMEKMPTVIVQRDQEAKNGSAGVACDDSVAGEPSSVATQRDHPSHST